MSDLTEQLRKLREGVLARAMDAEAERDRLAAELANVSRERDLAIAHDRQPYPTADAYERACAAHHKHRQRADILGAAIKELKDLACTCPEDDLKWLTDLRKRVIRWADEALNEDAEARSRRPDLNGEPWAFLYAERDRLTAELASMTAQRDSARDAHDAGKRYIAAMEAVVEAAKEVV